MIKSNVPATEYWKKKVEIKKVKKPLKKILKNNNNKKGVINNN
jgi:hypothetical protein